MYKNLEKAVLKRGGLTIVFNRAKPKIVISKCINFAACRYDGAKINDEFINRLTEFIDVITVCPEVEIGLGVPRDSLRLVQEDEEIRLIQSATGQDYTVEMKNFSRDFLANLAEVDGFILKNRSPSCAIKDAKYYSNQIPSGTTAGLFGLEVKKFYPNVTIENEGRLKNFQIRENFLRNIFLLADFRSIESSEQMKELVAFHSRHKYLFMAYNQQILKKLGRIVANHNNIGSNKVITNYKQELFKLLADSPSYKDNINVLMHLMGYFSNDLLSEEKEYFLGIIEKYRANQLPLSVPLGIINSWIIKYKKDYLSQQSFLNPYPEELVDIKDSGKGRGS